MQKAKGAPGSRRFEQVEKVQYHDHAALAHWPHSLHFSFAPVPFNRQKRKGCFCFSVSVTTGNNGSVPLSHGACRRKSKRTAFAALHHCRHCRSCRFDKQYNMSLSRCARTEERTSSAIFTCGVRPPSLFLQGRYTLSASPRHHCCHVSCNLKKQEARQQLRKALALRS